jgi:hypothetical protein
LVIFSDCQFTPGAICARVSAKRIEKGNKIDAGDREEAGPYKGVPDKRG